MGFDSAAHTEQLFISSAFCNCHTVSRKIEKYRLAHCPLYRGIWRKEIFLIRLRCPPWPCSLLGWARKPSNTTAVNIQCRFILCVRKFTTNSKKFNPLVFSVTEGLLIFWRILQKIIQKVPLTGVKHHAKQAKLCHTPSHWNHHIKKQGIPLSQRVNIIY